MLRSMKKKKEADEQEAFTQHNVLFVMYDYFPTYIIHHRAEAFMYQY